MSAFNIGLSGLQTSQKVIDMLSHNIANADTPGYKRHENHNFEINFSGSDNKPYMPAGVGTTISSNDFPWLDKRMSDALQEKAMNDAVQEGVSDLEKVTTDDTLEKSFTAFMNASQDLLANKNDPVLKEALNQTGQAFVANLNRVDKSFSDVGTTLQQKIDLHQIRIDTLQQQMSELATKSNTKDVVAEMNYLKQQLSQATGSLAGYNKVLQSILPPVTGIYEAAKTEVINGINASYGGDLISSGFSWNNLTGGNIDKLVEFGSQKFNMDLGRLKTIVGSMLESANIGSNFSSQNLNATQEAYESAYGVDLVDQSVKMKQYQRMYEANAQVIKTADAMLGTLLNIFS